jgi:hypothetical protein
MGSGLVLHPNLQFAEALSDEIAKELSDPTLDHGYIALKQNRLSG